MSIIFLTTQISRFSYYIFICTLRWRHLSLFFPIISGDRDKAPGQRECDYSIDNINKCIRDIEQASLAAVGQTLPCRDDISMEVSSNPPSAVSCVRGKMNLMRSVVFLLRLLL